MRIMSARNIHDLLSETFSVYASSFRDFVAVAAVVQIPVALVTLGVSISFPQTSTLALLLTSIISMYGVTVGYAAGVHGVCLHYLGGDVDLGKCYIKSVGKAKTLAVFTGLLATLLFLPMILLLQSNGVVVFLAGIITLPVFVLGLYLSFVVQVAMVEGVTINSALRRSFELVRGSWWRVFGITVVLFLVVLGVRIVVNIPFAILFQGLSIEQVSVLNQILAILVATISSIIALPVLFIFSTLLYYDLRVRKEEYSLVDMSSETGIAYNV